MSLVCVCVRVCVCTKLNGLTALSEVSSCLGQIGRSLLSSRESSLTDEAEMFVSCTLSVAVNHLQQLHQQQQLCQSHHLSQLLDIVASVTDKYSHVSCISARCSAYCVLNLTAL